MSNAATRKRMLGNKIAPTKLDGEKVRQIRQMLSLGWSEENCAIVFYVHRSTIHKIRTGITWKHVL